MDENGLLFLSPAHFQLLFKIAQAHLCRNGTAYSRLGPETSICIQENASQLWPQAIVEKVVL